MSRSLILIVLVGGLTVACQPSGDEVNSTGADTASSEASRPNVVLVIADDHGYPYSGFMGADYVQTPHLDALAASGTVFVNGYVPANHCRPSLQTLITGLLPVQYDALTDSVRDSLVQTGAVSTLGEEARAAWEEEYGFQSMRHVQTLPRVLAAQGYRTFQGGKWWEYHFENGGFTHGMTTGWTAEQRHDPDWFKEFMGGDGLDLARVTNEAVYDFVDESGDDPFFVWYAPELPHYPFTAPEQYQSLYADADMTESAKLYYANVSWFDDQLGQFLDFLEARGKRENTLIVFVNDNGWEQNPDQEFVGDPMRFNNGGDKGKLSMYDQSFRTPLIWSWPGHIPAGERREALAHSADLPVTILDLLGLPPLPGTFGESLRPVLAGDGEGREMVQGRVTQVRWEGDMMGRQTQGYWLREDDWFFSWDATTEYTRLFNLSADPQSDRNVADAHADRVARYRQRVAEWRERYEGT